MFVVHDTLCLGWFVLQDYRNCAVLCCAVLCCTVLCCTVLCCAVLYCAVVAAAAGAAADVVVVVVAYSL